MGAVGSIGDGMVRLGATIYTIEKIGRAIDQKRRRPELFRAAQVAANRGAVEHDGA